MKIDFPISTPVSPQDEKQEVQPSSDLTSFNVQLQAEQENLEHQQACLHAWNSVQEDMQQLHELFNEFNKLVTVSIYDSILNYTV